MIADIILKRVANYIYIPIYSTISRIPTTLKYSPLLLVTENGKVEIITTDQSDAAFGMNPAEVSGFCNSALAYSQQTRGTEIGSTLQHGSLWEQNLTSRCCVVNISPIYTQLVPKIRENGATLFVPLESMRFVLPTSRLDLPCAVPNFTAIGVGTAKPAYSVYTLARFSFYGQAAPLSTSKQTRSVWWTTLK